MTRSHTHTHTPTFLWALCLCLPVLVSLRLSAAAVVLPYTTGDLRDGCAYVCGLVGWVGWFSFTARLPRESGDRWDLTRNGWMGECRVQTCLDLRICTRLYIRMLCMGSPGKMAPRGGQGSAGAERLLPARYVHFFCMAGTVRIQPLCTISPACLPHLALPPPDLGHPPLGGSEPWYQRPAIVPVPWQHPCTVVAQALSLLLWSLSMNTSTTQYTRLIQSKLLEAVQRSYI